MSSISNQTIINKTIVDKYVSDGNKLCSKWLFEECKKMCKPIASENAYTSACESVFKKFKKLQKSAGREKGKIELTNFLKSNIVFPKPLINKRKNHTVFQDCCSSEDLKIKALAVNQVSMEMLKENKALKAELVVHKLKLKKTLNKKISIDGLKLRVKDLTTKKKALILSNDAYKNMINNKNSELKRLRSRLAYTENVKNQDRKKDENLKTDLQTARASTDSILLELNTMKQEMKDVQNENDWLREILKNYENEQVKLFDEDKGTYKPALQKCVYLLLKQHVSTGQVSGVIETVLSMVNKKCDRLPSASTVQNMSIQKVSIAYKHIADVCQDKKNTSLYTDETSKFGNKVCGYHVRDSEGIFFTLGMRDLVSKSGKDTLEALKDILSDIDNTAHNTECQTSKAILTNIKSTMSDSASTEVKFNELLEEYRTSVLPYTVENYDTLNEESKLSVSKLFNFFCGLHSLVHFAETSNKSLIQVEDEFFDGDSPIHDKSFAKQTESGACRLVRTACKAFARGADEKNGCHIQFVTYISDFLKENKYRTLKLTPYRGNRFNILFHNAAHVFMLHKQMTIFLENYSLNRLTKSVLHDLKQPFYIAGCKALGLVNKIVSTPFWNILEDKNIHIMDMNMHYLGLANSLTEASANVDDFMAGQIRPFPNYVKEDNLLTVLLEESEYDQHCIAILNIILPALCQYVRRKFAEFLPGGQFNIVTQEQRDQTRSVEKHNKHCERVFAYYDQLLRFKPNISTLATESYIMFSLNNTSQWLNEKSTDVADKIVIAARKEVSEIRKKFKERKLVIQQSRQEKLAKQRADAEAKRQKKIQENELITKDIIYHGLWQSHKEIIDSLSTYKSKTLKIAALKAQLRFRKQLLKQKPDNSTVFNFSKNGVQLNVTELTENIKTLVSDSLSLPVRPQNDGSAILLNKRVSHKFGEGDNTKWYYGRVISQVPGFLEWFNIVYDEEGATVYTHKLMEDYKKQELVLVV